VKAFSGNLGFLSNFARVDIILDDMWFPTVEHAYQAAKTDDMEARRRIQKLEKPGQAKREGRKVRMREDWTGLRIGVMRGLLQQKFEQPRFREKLLATNGMWLVEENDWGDTFWGVCDGVGENWLGTLLMEIRAEIVAKNP
jgi:ribA/ribD-fused uncharacterized protein